MISLLGQNHIKRYLAGFVPGIAQSVAFGLGPKAEANTDTKLQFEFGRSDVILTSYDFVNNKLIFKAAVDDDFAGTIYEVAIYSLPADANAGEFGSKLLTSFDSATEEWVDSGTSAAATFSTATVRIGADALRHTPALSTTKSDALREVSLDFSGYSSADKFVLAYNVGNANTSNIKVRFAVDATNYYEFSLGAQTAGYKVTEFNKGSATVTGTPNWNAITEIWISTTSGAGGASQVDYDGLRIDDADAVSGDYVMVSRRLLTTPFVKQQGKVQEIEFALDINIT